MHAERYAFDTPAASGLFGALLVAVALTAEGKRRIRRHCEQLERLKRLSVKPART